MTANELADYLEVSPNMTVFKAAAMLRQQQAEIEALKAELEHMRSFFGCDPAYYGMTYDAKKHGIEE
jgi:hypothetical protein